MLNVSLKISQMTETDFVVSKTTPVANLLEIFHGFDIHLAVINNDLTALQLQSQLFARTEWFGHTALSLACLLNRVDAAMLLLDIGTSNVDHRATLLVALEHAHESIVLRLMPNIIATLLHYRNAHTGDSIAHYAAKNHSVDVLATLCRAGVQTLTPNWSDELPVHFAAKYSCARVLHFLLLEMPPHVNARTRLWRTNLSHCAAQNADDEVIGVLIAQDAMFAKETTLFGVAPIHLAAANPNEGVIARLIAANADFNAAAPYGTPCFVACRNPNAKVLDLLLAADASLAGDAAQNTLCHAAASNRNAAVMRRVLSLNIDVNARNKTGETALFEAAARGTSEVVAMLLAAGAAVDVVDSYERNVCHAAAKNADPAVIRQLIAAGAAFDAPQYHGKLRPMDQAVHERNACVLRELAIAGVDVSVMSNGNGTLSSLFMGIDVSQASAMFFLIKKLKRSASTSVVETAFHFGTHGALLVAFAIGVDFSAMRVHFPPSNADARLTWTAIGVDFDTRWWPALLRGRESGDNAGVLHVSEVMTKSELTWLRNRFATRQFELMRARSFEVCVGLRTLDLPALIVCLILDNVFAPVESVVPFHRVWSLVTKVKHFVN
jgi:ankyrin repeat protein